LKLDKTCAKPNSRFKRLTPLRGLFISAIKKGCPWAAFFWIIKSTVGLFRWSYQCPREAATPLNFQLSTTQTPMHHTGVVYPEGLSAGHVLPQPTFDIQINHPNASIHTPTRLNAQNFGLNRTVDLPAHQDTAIDLNITLKNDACADDEIKFIQGRLRVHGWAMSNID
jgi:hypothetical protein